MIGPNCTKITGYPDEHHYVPWWVICCAFFDWESR